MSRVSGFGMDSGRDEMMCQIIWGRTDVEGGWHWTWMNMGLLHTRVVNVTQCFKNQNSLFFYLVYF